MKSNTEQPDISLTDEVLVDIVGSSSNHSDLAEQREGDAIDSADEAVDLFVAAGLLLPKLVAGESQYVEVIGPKVALELLQVFVVLLSEATFTGYVYHQGHLKPRRHTVRPNSNSPHRTESAEGERYKHAPCLSQL